MWKLEFLKDLILVHYSCQYTLAAFQITSHQALFADNTFLLSVVKNIDSSPSNLNRDLTKISGWTFQQQINLNTDPAKQTQRIIFSQKSPKQIHPKLLFNQSLFIQFNFQKHLAIFLDTQLIFREHLSNIFIEANKAVGSSEKSRISYLNLLC